MGRLTTHVLDTANGTPAADIFIELYRLSDPDKPIASATTDADGRCHKPLLEGDVFSKGEYQLVFHAGDYFAAKGPDSDGQQFLNQVVIRFVISDSEQHYHVPLLLSPFGYTTYRGS